MEAWPLLIGFILILLIGVPIWLIARAVSASHRLDELTRRLAEMERELFLLKKGPPTDFSELRHTPPPVATASVPFAEPIVPAPVIQRVESPPAVPLSIPPPLPPPELAPVLIEPAPAPTPRPSINWEQFMGVKMFAWVGGLALFLGVAFFLKYSFDNNLIPPELRVTIGFLAGLGLLVGGVVMSRKNYSALSQTLCATGVVVLYAVTFACRSIYHFSAFGPLPTFLLMVLITSTAFFTAVRLNALVVAILGLLGGFLTPFLLSTGVDNPLGLFAYIALLDAGLLFIALHRRWHFLAALGALGTAVMQIGWAEKFFVAEKYFASNKILIALGVLLGFTLLYSAAVGWARRRGQSNPWFSGSAFALAVVALAFAAWFLTFVPLATRPWLMFSFVLLLDLAVVALVFLDDFLIPVQPAFGLAVFAVLAAWTNNFLSAELLNSALVFYFLFAVLHSGLPLLLKRRRPESRPLWGSQIFAPLALILVLIPIFNLPVVSFMVWPFVLLVDVLAIAIAVLSVSLLPVIAVLLLTLIATGALIFKIPQTLTGLPMPFFLLGAFAVFFVAATVWLVRRWKPAESDSPAPNLAVLLPGCSAVLPFLLLIMATLRLPLANPSPVFGLALLLVVLLLGLSKIFSFDSLPAIGLASVAALECAWHFNHFDTATASTPLIWYLIFYAIFTAFPFLFRKQFADRVTPWATAAVAGLPQFFLMHRLVAAAYPNHSMGLLPLAFTVAPLASLVVVLKNVPGQSPSRTSQLAWFGGVALFFITLIFPIQFDRQWITIGWALEGAALLWLFHRVPHPGLRLTGVALLIAAFVRLTFNPAVLGYHPRSVTPILNWYLYAYGTVTACLFAGARLLAPPRHLVLKCAAPPLLAGLGVVLAFLLLNIEVADFFSTPGSSLTFQFHGNFARDLAYSISWGLFALVLLVIGIVKKIRPARYAALGLLSLTLFKLFFHDLSSLGPLYRIGALIGVAVIAMLASLAYQKFFTISKIDPTPHETAS